MSYKLEEIKELGREIGEIKGVQAVILYGSYARGDFDEGSDVDLLIVFQDPQSLKHGWRSAMKITAKRNIFIQAVIMAVNELRSSALLSSILREGKILYSTQSFNLLGLAKFKPYALITYNLSKMSPNRKIKCIQTLYGRKSGKYTYKGVLTQLNGLKIGRNSLMIPFENIAKLTDFLDKEGITYVVRHVWCN